jgi:hypothetical protein
MPEQALLALENQPQPFEPDFEPAPAGPASASLTGFASAPPAHAGFVTTPISVLRPGRDR